MLLCKHDYILLFSKEDDDKKYYIIQLCRKCLKMRIRKVGRKKAIGIIEKDKTRRENEKEIIEMAKNNMKAISVYELK